MMTEEIRGSRALYPYGNGGSSNVSFFGMSAAATRSGMDDENTPNNVVATAHFNRVRRDDDDTLVVVVVVECDAVVICV